MIACFTGGCLCSFLLSIITLKQVNFYSDVIIKVDHKIRPAWFKAHFVIEMSLAQFSLKGLQLLFLNKNQVVCIENLKGLQK
jgi:hypothetical protein